ncbi:ABC transporter type 1, transmembrane domain-containing protein [Bisporella sp. PMI_857]|nr:ABC transporter type 1, transmembrane domain-containing protein [Bisporella sp. PMI_857]
MPLMTVIFGNLTGTFQGFVLGGLSDSFDTLPNRYILYFIYLAVGEFVFAYVSTALFIYTREHITSKIRRQYLRAIPKQNFGFLDELGAGEITTRITADTNLIQETVPEKVGVGPNGIAILCGGRRCCYSLSAS